MEWLGDVIDGAGVESIEEKSRARMGGDHDDRDIPQVGPSHLLSVASLNLAELAKEHAKNMERRQADLKEDHAKKIVTHKALNDDVFAWYKAKVKEADELRRSNERKDARIGRLQHRVEFWKAAYENETVWSYACEVSLSMK